MDRNDVRTLVLNAINEIQKQSGRPMETLEDNIRPFSDLEGFDSLNGEEVTVILREDLLFGDDMNPFESEKDDELTIREIVDRLARMAKHKEKEKVQ